MIQISSEKNVGHFHGLDFNPYMRALYYKIELLAKSGNKKEANILVHKILLLDINDHMGER